MDGLVVGPGEGRTIESPAQRVIFKVTGENSRSVSTFENTVPPGFDVGAHYHLRTEELFYLLEGELEVLAFQPRDATNMDWRTWESAGGLRAVRIQAGACMFVPAGCPHAFRNPTGKTARMLFQSAPPADHERYLEKLVSLTGSSRAADRDAIVQLREEYDVHEMTPLRFGEPS